MVMKRPIKGEISLNTLSTKIRMEENYKTILPRQPVCPLRHHYHTSQVTYLQQLRISTSLSLSISPFRRNRKKSQKKMIAINASCRLNITFLSRKKTPDSPSPSLETANDVQENGYKINVCYRHPNFIFERSQEGMVAILAKRCLFTSGFLASPHLPWQLANPSLEVRLHI